MRSTRLLAGALAGLFLASFLFPQDAEATQETPKEQVRAAREALGLVAKRLSKVVELHADYYQEQESLLLAEPLVSTGRFHLRLDPGCLVLDLKQPAPAIIRSDAKSHRVYDPKAGRAEVFLFEENRLTTALIACFRADLEEVEKVFTIQSYEEKYRKSKDRGPVRRGHLLLVPREPRLQQVMRSLALVIDIENGVPIHVTQTNREGEVVRFGLQEAQLLEKPHERSKAIFSADLPAGTKVAERRVETK